MTAGRREFYAKIKFGISAHFFRKKRRERGDLSVKMDSRVRGNDSGEAGICRREITAAGNRKSGGGVNSAVLVSPPTNVGGESKRGENVGGGGDSDLHRNGKSWKLGKKNLPFRRTPESLRRFRFTSEWKKLEIRKKEFTIPANAGISAGDSDLHRNGKK